MTQLFKGQTTHPLTEEEVEAFYQQVDIVSLHGFWTRNLASDETRRWYEAQLKAGLNEMLKTPTGREQARAIIASGKNYTVYGELPENIPDGVAGYSTDGSNDVHVRLDTDEKEMGRTIIHELLHARQKHRKGESKVLEDAETQALNCQLDMEARGDNKQTTGYEKSYEINKKKWYDRAKGTRGYPKGYTGLRFEPAPGLSPEKMEEARKQYAIQMASLETRAQATKDFVKPTSEWGKNSSLPVADYDLARLREFYSSRDGYYYDEGKRPHVSQAAAQDVASRNPFLHESDFNSLYKEKAKEKPTTEEDRKKSDSAIKDMRNMLLDPKSYKRIVEVVKREKDPEFRKKALSVLKKMSENKDVSYDENLIVEHTYLCNLTDSEITPQKKKEELYQVIVNLEKNCPDKKGLRKRMINRTAKAAGTDRLPLVQNQENGDPTNTLRRSGKEYSEREESTVNQYSAGRDIA